MSVVTLAAAGFPSFPASLAAAAVPFIINAVTWKHEILTAFPSLDSRQEGGREQEVQEVRSTARLLPFTCVKGVSKNSSLPSRDAQKRGERINSVFPLFVCSSQSSRSFMTIVIRSVSSRSGLVFNCRRINLKARAQEAALIKQLERERETDTEGS